MYRASIIGAVLFAVAVPAAAQLVSVQLDYPPAELRAGIQGVVGFEVALAKDGKVTGCKITQTSGNADLDRQTCSQLRKTGQFKPAVDPAGQPIKSTYASRLRWSLPHTLETAPAPAPAPQ
ncbi:MAG TPA: energy transducer TonB [Sphingomonas sp.]|uniref:energy transducer TonB n=1 Tax=Sphingomonas sp. TaxID=28214 RepID=UPI002CED2493|nr:energy transducer TonB [Sphingomonas sp.]HMI18709.1 energy transducer TonB [Sphingomonas sp.]